MLRSQKRKFVEQNSIKILYKALPLAMIPFDISLRSCHIMFMINVLQLDNVGDVIEKIRIGHDNKGITAGWHLDKVEVRRLKDDGETSTSYTFPCVRWLAKDEDDGSVVRELIPQKVVEETITEDGDLETKEIDQEQLERKSRLSRSHN